MEGGTVMIYLYDGTYDGLLSAVFEAFSHREAPDNIVYQEPEQIDFFQTIHPIATHAAHARRVEQGIVRAIGGDALNYVWAALHSAEPYAGRDLLLFLRRGFEKGASVTELLTEDCVVRVMRMSRSVFTEAARWREFLRFEELSIGVFIAQYEPENDVTELLMPHFSDRFCTQPFIIHDKGRQKAGVCQNGHWTLASSQRMVLPENSAQEAAYQNMWRLFYNTVSIKARENPRLRRQMMPKKFWKDMIEMQGKV